MGLSPTRTRLLEQMHVRYPRMYRGLRVIWRALRRRFRDYPRYRRKLMRLAGAFEDNRAPLAVHVLCHLDDAASHKEVQRLRRSLRQQEGVEVHIDWLGDTMVIARAGPLPSGERDLAAHGEQWRQALLHDIRRTQARRMVMTCHAGTRFLPGALRAVHLALQTQPATVLAYGDHEYLQRGRLRLAAKGVFDQRLAPIYAEQEPYLAFDADWLTTKLSSTAACPDWTGLLAHLLSSMDETAVAHLPLPVVRMERDHQAAKPTLGGAKAGQPAHGEAGAAHLLQSEMRVAAIIPTRDGVPHLPLAVDSALAAMGACGCSGRVIVIDNGSEQPATLDYLRTIDRHERSGIRVEVWRYDYPFNYAAMHNWAVAALDEELLLLLNDDIEALPSTVAGDAGWLAEMLACMADARVGAVGAQLRYPNGALQHAGVVLGLGVDHIAGHVGVGLEPEDERLTDAGMGRIRAVSAVTAACMVTRRTLFQSLGGFEAIGLPVAFNDVDYCLRLRAAGYDIVMAPAALLTHHESLTRGQDHDPAKRARFESECAFMKSRWGDALLQDPYYSPHYSMETADLSLRAAPEPRALRARTAQRPVALR